MNDLTPQLTPWVLAGGLFVLSAMGVAIAAWLRRRNAGLVSENERRRTTEASLRESEARLNAVVTGVVDGIITIDERGRILSLNPAAERIFGFTIAELVGQSLTLLMPEQDWSDHTTFSERSTITGFGAGEEIVGRRKDESMFPLELAVSKVSLGDRRMFVAIVRDITKRKRAQAELRESEERFELAVRGSSDGIWDWDVLSNEVFYSTRFKALLGYDDESFPNVFDSFESHLHPGDHGFTFEAVRAHLEERVPYDVEYRLRTSSGPYRWFNARGQAVWDAAGRATRMAGSITEITDRKLAEQVLERKTLEAQLIHQATSMAAATNSFEEALQHCIDIVCEMSEWPVGHVYLPTKDLADDVLQPTSIWHLADAEAYTVFREATDRTTFARGVGLPGRIWASGEPAWIVNVQEDRNFPRNRLTPALGVKGAFGFPIKLNHEVAAVLEFFTTGEMEPDDNLLMMVRSVGEQVGRVIERNQAAADLRRAKEAAESANLAKSQFLANMSHELRTPLNGIMGYSYLLQEEAKDRGQDEMVDDLKQIHAAGEHLLGLINEILDLAKIEAGRMELVVEPFETEAMLREVTTAIRPLAEQSGDVLHLETAGNLGTMRTDPTRTRQVLFNLLANACKFTENGEVTLRARRESEDGLDTMCFEVVDTGIGIDVDVLEHIFDEFSQADNSTTRRYGGTGLGLAITRRFCHMMGGTISVDSVPGRGSSFTVRLPCEIAGLAPVERGLPPLPTAAPESAYITPTPPGDGPLVLSIDDDPNARELLCRTLALDGFRVVACSSGSEGIALARDLQPLAITLDVMMPETDGWTVLSLLQSDPATCNIPVIMVTMVDDQSTGYALGATEFLTKPFDRTRLRAIMQRFRARGSDAPILIVEDDAPARRALVRTLEREQWRIVAVENGRVALDAVARERPQLILLDLMMPEMDGFDFVQELRRTAAGRTIPIVVVTARDLTDNDRKRLHGCVDQILQKGAYGREELLGQVRDLLRARVDLSKAEGR